MDLRLIEGIVCEGCVSASDVQCDVFDLWGNYKVGTFKNQFIVPTMDPHNSNAYKFKCKYL